MNLLSLLKAAGPLLWVLAALSVYTVYLIVLRVQALSRLGRDASVLIERARATTAESGAQTALAELDRVDPTNSELPAVRVMRAGLSRAERGPEAAQAAMNGAILQEDARLYAGLSTLGTIAQIAPLLGLLGTVIGMVNSFIVFSHTASPTPTQLATGISEALMNTAGGLIVAIMAYVARNSLRARADLIAMSAERVREELPTWLTRPVRFNRPEGARADMSPLEFSFEQGGRS